MKTKIFCTGVVLGLMSTAIQAGSENVAWPANYKTAFTHYFSGDRTANGNQIIRAYANQVVIEGAKAGGNLPYGSVVVGEIYAAKLNDKGGAVVSALGRRIADKLAAIVVMQRGEGFDAQYPETLKVGDWEFAVFSPAGERLDKDITGCRTCHHPLADRQFLFSYQHLAQ